MIEIREILSNKELEEIYDKSVGFVFNDYPTNDGIKYKKLHRADCHSLNPNNINRLKVKGKNGIKLPKFYFETLDEAYDCLKKNRSDVGYSDCGFCMV